MCECGGGGESSENEVEVKVVGSIRIGRGCFFRRM